jgi:hypothetical protein
MDKLSGTRSGTTVTITFQAQKAIPSTANAEIRLHTPPGFTFACGASFRLFNGDVQGFKDVTTASGRVVTCVNSTTDNDSNTLSIPVQGLVVVDAFQGKRSFGVEVQIPKYTTRRLPIVWIIETFDGTQTVEFGRFLLN